MRNKNRTATIDWILQRDWKLAITLTFKKDCTEHRARKTMRRLWNGIDRQLYHKAFKKQGKRVERVCAFEKGQSGTHYHYHIATSPPNDIDVQMLKAFRKWVGQTSMQKSLQMRELLKDYVRFWQTPALDTAPKHRMCAGSTLMCLRKTEESIWQFGLTERLGRERWLQKPAPSLA